MTCLLLQQRQTVNVPERRFNRTKVQPTGADRCAGEQKGKMQDAELEQGFDTTGFSSHLRLYWCSAATAETNPHIRL